MKKFSAVVVGALLALTALPALSDDGSDTLRTRRTNLFSRDVTTPTAPAANSATLPVVGRNGVPTHERVTPPQLEPTPLPEPEAEFAAPEADLQLEVGPIAEIPGLVMRDRPVVLATPGGEVLARIRSEQAALVARDLPVDLR